MEGPSISDRMDDSLAEVGGLEGLNRLSLDRNVIKRLEGVYSLLSCSSRIEILYYLNFSPLTPGMLNGLTGMAPNLLSFHLGKLRAAALVRSERRGRNRIYSITDLGKGVSGPLSA